MNKELVIKSLFWLLVSAMVAVCCFFIMHNAAWLLGDDCQTISYTGWDKPIFGFFVSPSLGRFFPLDYTIYDVLCLFYDGQIPPSAHLFMHVLGLLLFMGSIVALAFYMLRELELWRKYLITFLVLVVFVGRSYALFLEIWTGIWTIFAFLALFLLCHIKFLDSEKWSWGIVGLVAINYVLYYYETMFTIPMALGICALLFSYKKMNKSIRIYNYLLILSGIIFLGLYAILVLPRVDNFYTHHLEESLLANAAKMFYAQKIMWIVLVLLIYRAYLFIKKRAEFNAYDSMLLASCAYCCGAAVLGLNYTLYYIPGVLVAIPAILYFSLEYLKSNGTIILFSCLALFYGRYIPTAIKNNQSSRVATYSAVQHLISEIRGDSVYFYAVENPELEEWEVILRNWQKSCLQNVTGWYMNDRSFTIESKKVFNHEVGLWQVMSIDQESFLQLCPSAIETVDFSGYKIYRVPRE